MCDIPEEVLVSFTHLISNLPSPKEDEEKLVIVVDGWAAHLEVRLPLRWQLVEIKEHKDDSSCDRQKKCNDLFGEDN